MDMDSDKLKSFFEKDVQKVLDVSNEITLEIKVKCECGNVGEYQVTQDKFGDLVLSEWIEDENFEVIRGYDESHLVCKSCGKKVEIR